MWIEYGVPEQIFDDSDTTSRDIVKWIAPVDLLCRIGIDSCHCLNEVLTIVFDMLR